jgi:regulator of sirC expression with transglutaminase-like and TPR domain
VPDDDIAAVDRLTYADELAQDAPRLIVAALLYAREIAHPRLAPSHYLRRLNNWGELLRSLLSDAQGAAARAVVVSQFLTDDLGFRGNEDDYYGAANSYVNEVIETRMGLPIALSAIFLHFAEIAGLEGQGIGLPGHFIVAVRDGETQLFFDPFEGTGPLDVEALRPLLHRRTGFRGAINPAWLEPQGTRAILARMLFNLRAAYLSKNDWQHAARVIERLVVTQPEVHAHLRDLGFILARAGRPLSAAKTLQRYLLAEPDADDAEMVRGSVDSLFEQGARLN